MNIGDAMEAIKTGARVQRAIWVTENRNWWVAYTPAATNVPASQFTSTAVAAFVATLPGGVINTAPIVTLFVPGLLDPNKPAIHFGWVAEQVDMLAEDWQVLA